MPRDGRNVTSSEGIDKPCKKCNKIEGDDNWVCCDVCETWEHFRCAGVNESIAEKSWKCSDCLTDWDGADDKSKSGVSFNESSVSKSSSRASQRLHLSLQHLEEQRKLSKLRAEEELQMKKREEEARLQRLQMEEAAKLKQLDEEQEYLKQRYNLLMQLADEKDSSSRRSRVSVNSKRTGVSVKSKRDQLEKWLKVAAEGEAGQSKPSSSEQGATLPVSETIQPSGVIGGMQLPAVSLQNSSSQVSTHSKVNLLRPPTSEIMGNVPTLAKSFEQLLSSQRGGVSTVPAFSATVAGQFESLVPLQPTTIASNAALSGMPVLGIRSSNSVSGALPTATSALGTVVSAAPIMTSHIGLSGLMPTVYGSHSYYTAAPMGHLASTNAVVSEGPVQANPLLSSQSCAAPQGIPLNTTVGYGNRPVTNPVVTSMIQPPFAAVGSLEPGYSGMRISPSVGPSSAQLAARQVMPRELPKFNGDPQEWPIFFSSFKNTTEVCGYIEAENLGDYKMLVL